MTLIAGTVGWNGVYLATDTRVTKKPQDGSSPYPSDDVLKCEMIKGGIAIAVAGSAYVSGLLKITLERNHLSWYSEAVEKKRAGHIFTETPGQVLEELVRSSIQEVFSLSEVMKLKSADSKIAGLVAIIDIVPMELNQHDCTLLIEIIEMAKSTNNLVTKYVDQVRKCSNGELDGVVIEECMQGCLVAYESIAATATSRGILNVEPVRIGEIRVYGTGISLDHETDSKETLKYMLCETPPSDLASVAFHLTRTHGLSDIQVAPDQSLGFKTFGGGIIPTFLVEDSSNPGHVGLLVVEGEIRKKSDGSVYSEVFHDKAGKLFVKTSDGETLELIKFSEYKSKDNLLFATS